jgi:hypothetical protein
VVVAGQRKRCATRVPGRGDAGTRGTADTTRHRRLDGHAYAVQPTRPRLLIDRRYGQHNHEERQDGAAQAERDPRDPTRTDGHTGRTADIGARHPSRIGHATATAQRRASNRFFDGGSGQPVGRSFARQRRASASGRPTCHCTTCPSDELAASIEWPRRERIGMRTRTHPIRMVSPPARWRDTSAVVRGCSRVDVCVSGLPS